MNDMNDSPFYFGPLGRMERVWLDPGVEIQTSRGLSEWISSGGTRHVQLGRTAPRIWAGASEDQLPATIRLIGLAAHGLLDQCWLYDVAEARENMVPAGLSAGSGIPVPVDGLVMGALPPGQVVYLPVLAGRLYSVSAWRAASGTMVTYQVGSAPKVTVESFNGSGGASFTPIQDSILTLVVTGPGVSGLRAVDGDWDGTYQAGYGTPCKVAVQDPVRTLQLVTEQVRSDYSVTIMEVGKPGHL